MALASADKLVLGSVAFAVFWILAVFPAVPVLPVGRTAGSLLGAVLMIVFRVLSPEQAYAAVDLSVLGLLFGTMLVGIFLERADMFKYLGKLLSWKCCGAKDLLCRICVVSALSSALFTNDTTCIVLTEFVLMTAKESKVPPHPFLLALASSANIGSSATPIGNPQNLVIAIQSGISFGQFLLGIVPAMLVGIVVNMVILLCMYWKVLSGEEQVKEIALEEGRNLPKIAADTSEDEESGKPCSETEQNLVPVTQSDERKEGMFSARRRRLVSKTCAYLVTAGMLVALLMGLNMSWTVITASLILIVLDFKDAGPCLEKVSYSILLLFCGMFITVEGFNRTGIPSALWDLTNPHAQINRASGLVVLALVILVLSNVASNVPTVLLLGGRVAAGAAAISTHEVKKAWLVLAWVSTVAGNLSLPGSAANLIVCEQARKAQSGKYTLSFLTHLKFGLPSTLIITAVGLTLIRG